MFISRPLCNRDEEANQEQDHYQNQESDGVLECTPEPVTNALRAFLGSNLIVLFVPEVGEWHNQQA